MINMAYILKHTEQPSIAKMFSVIVNVSIEVHNPNPNPNPNGINLNLGKGQIHDETLIKVSLIQSFMFVDSLMKVGARKRKKVKDSALLSLFTRSSPASGPGQSAIAVAYLESRFAWDSATSTPSTCMSATDEPIRRSPHAARGQCPRRLDN